MGKASTQDIFFRGLFSRGSRKCRGVFRVPSRIKSFGPIIRTLHDFTGKKVGPPNALNSGGCIMTTQLLPRKRTDLEIAGLRWGCWFENRDG